jgi:hypothetical protein
MGPGRARDERSGGAPAAISSRIVSSQAIQPGAGSDAKDFASLAINVAERHLLKLMTGSPQWADGTNRYGCEPPNRLDGFSYFHHSHAESLLVVPDRRIDPALAGWLDKHVARAQAFTSPKEQLASLLQSAREAFPKGMGGLLDFKGKREFREYTESDQESPRLLGEFLELRMGCCRHISPLIQLGVERLGIPGFIVYGKLETVWNGKVEDGAYHAANIVLVDKAVRFVDPIHKFNLPIDSTSVTTVPDEIRQRFRNYPIRGETRRSIFGEERFDFTPKQTMLDGLMELTGEDVNGVLTAFRRAQDKR